VKIGRRVDVTTNAAAPSSGRGVFAALRRAVPVFLSARILGVVLVPLGFAALAFILVGWLGWTPLTHWLETSVFAGDASAGGASGWRAVAVGIVAFVALMLIAVLTALVAIALLAMPIIVRTVAERDFPGLERRRGGTFAGSLANAVLALALFIPAWLASLLLLPLPPVFAVTSLSLSAWLNQRLLRYDALAEHASAGEMRALFRGARRRLFGLGLALAPLSYVPVLNVLAPLYAGVAFTYLCLDELAAARARAPAA
jgi:CysZ protein